MKQRFLIKIALVLALTPTFTGWAQTPEKWWERANSAYTGGDYPEAILHYDSIRAQGYVSARLYYNLANAYYKDNQIGKAILNYNKALRLDPGNDDIKHNLAIANSYVRDRIDTVPEFFLKTWARELMYRAGTDSWAVMNLVFFALALALVLVYLLGRRMSWRKAGFYGAIVFLIFSVAALVFASIERRKILNPDQAIVMITAAPVKSEPNNTSKDVFVLHEGTRVRISAVLGDWREIVIADGNRGWIEMKSIELID